MNGPATLNGRPGEHLERFDPDAQSGNLIDAEHRCRYWWAAQAAAGRDVLDAACGTGYGTAVLAAAGAKSATGVDVSEEAVAAAQTRLGEAGTVRQADLRELPFADDSFDLVVSWETIEHVEEAERAIAEFRRVLRPDGLLLVSSPNPDVYPDGNEHHVKEYRAAELAALAGAHFANLATHRQHAWLASAIQGPAGELETAQGEGEGSPATRAVAGLAEGAQTYSLIAASDAELPPLQDLVTLGEGFEVRWWEEQLTATRRLLATTEAKRLETATVLRDTSNDLLDANQRLAQIPVLEHRIEEMEANFRQALADVEGSLSWRLTKPLRRLQAMRRRLG